MVNTLNVSTNSNVLSIKVITEPAKYNFFQLDSLNNYDAVVEFLSLDDLQMRKDFYIPSNTELKNIKENSVEINKNDDIYKEAITALNYEADYKSTLANNQVTPFSNDVEKGDVDNEYVLNHFLETKSFEEDYIALDYNNPSSIPSSDNQIVDIVPKSCFKTNGTYSYGGSKWGYFVNTYSDSTSDKCSSILLYKVDNIHFDEKNPDSVKIYPVLSYTYKYNHDTDCVYVYTPNNYCIARPEYATAIEYAPILENENNVTHKNPWESGYSYDDDNGYTFRSMSCYMQGVVKNYHHSSKIAQESFVKFGNIIQSLATIPLSLIAQFAVGATYDFITDIITKEINSKRQAFDEYGKKGSKYTISYKGIDNHESNFEMLERDNEPLKKIIKTSKSEDENDPLLFKDKDDFIMYNSELMSSGKSTDYTFAFHHQFNANIVNDNTNLFKKNPDKIGSVTANWSYYVGDDIRIPYTSLLDTAKPYISLAGKDICHNYSFVPKEEGDYKIILSEYSPNTSITINGSTSSSGMYEKELDDNTIVKIPQKNTLESIRHLSKNQECIISIKRKNYYTAFKLHVYKISSDFEYNGSYNNLQFNSTSIQTINYSCVSKLVPKASGHYTIAFAEANTSNIIKVLDSNYSTILDSSKYNKSKTTIELNLLKGSTYYISYYSKTESMRGKNITCIMGKHIPDIQDIIKKKTVTLNGLNANIPQYLLVRQNEQKQIKFQAGFSETYSGSPSIFFGIMDYSGSLLKFNSNLASKPTNYTLEADTFYILSFCLTSTKLTNVSIDIYLR